MKALKPYYRRGGVTIYKADAREVLPRFKNSSIDFIFTDPPYGHNNNDGDLIERWEAALGLPASSRALGRPIANDDQGTANTIVKWFFSEAARLLSCCCCCCCCCGGGGPDPQFAQKGKGKTRWYDRSHRIENIVRHIRKQIPQAKDHPTPKPVALAEHFIKLHARRGHLMLDAFMGGGSSLIAARNLGVRAIGVELSKKWCDLAIARLEA